MKKTITQRFFLSLCLMIVGCLWGSSAWAETVTYQHVFKAAPKTGNSITLTGVAWNISATNLNNYNNQSYAGVQFGTSSKNGQITLTSSSDWNYNGKTKITAVRLWLNRGGTSVTPKITIGGKSAISDGKVVAKNTNAGTDWTKATKVTFTPAADGNTGVVVIDVTSVNAGYICALEIDCEEAVTSPTLIVPSDPISFGEVESGDSDTQTFTFSGKNLTAQADLTISGTNAAMFSVSPTSVDKDSKGNIEEANVTVTYAPTTTGEHSATLTIKSGDITKTVSLSGTGVTPKTHYTVTWMVNGATYTEGTPSTDVVEGKKVATLPTNPADIGSNVFMGWTASAISDTSEEAPADLFTTAENAPSVTDNTTYYAVFAKRGGSAPTEELTQTLEYDSWTINGTTTDKDTYRLFHKDSYIESTVFDLSKLSKVIVYGGYFGGGTQNKLSIGDGTNIWKDVTVSGKKETGKNIFTDGTPLTGTGKLRVTSLTGTQNLASPSSATGVRISKVKIYIMTGGYTYSDYATTIITLPASNIHATTYYKKITSTDELVDGGQYVIVCAAENKGLLAGASNVHDATPATVVEENGTITTANAADMTEITFEKKTASTYYLNINNSKYIKAGSSSSTDLNVATGKDDKALWTIDFDASGNVEITSKAYETRGIIYYSSSEAFKNYAVSNRGDSKYPAIQLYQKVGEMPIAQVTGGITTYVADFAYSMPQHLVGHTVTSADEVGVITTYKAFRAGDEVPALTPLLIKSTEDYAAEEKSKIYYPAVLNKTVDAYTKENMLEYQRDESNMTKSKKTNVYYYKLAIKSDVVGFYWGEPEGGAFKMTKPSTAYLTVPKTMPVQGFVLNFEEGEPTGITTVTTDENAPIYNLQGIRMNGKNLPKGIYIQGGKKFMVK